MAQPRADRCADQRDGLQFFDLRDGRVSRYHLWLHAQFDESVVFDSSKGES